MNASGSMLLTVAVWQRLSSCGGLRNRLSSFHDRIRVKLYAHCCRTIKVGILAAPAGITELILFPTITLGGPGLGRVCDRGGRDGRPHHRQERHHPQGCDPSPQCYVAHLVTSSLLLRFRLSYVTIVGGKR